MAEEDYPPKSFMDRPKSRKGRSGGRKFTLPEKPSPSGAETPRAKMREQAAEVALSPPPTKPPEKAPFRLGDLKTYNVIDDWLTEKATAEKWGDGPQLSDLKVGPDVIDLDYNPNDGYDDDDTGDYEEDDTGDYEEDATGGPFHIDIEDFPENIRDALIDEILTNRPRAIFEDIEDFEDEEEVEEREDTGFIRDEG